MAMIWVVVFWLYTLILIILNRTLSKKSAWSDSVTRSFYSSLGECFIPLGVFWYMVIFAGIYWGFTNSDELFSKYKLSTGSYWETWLLVGIGISVALSYVVTYQYARGKGYTEAWYEQRLIDGTERREEGKRK
jgi:hypothetical protein